MTYSKLVLVGFGCFAERKEFLFADGINTMSELNEAGKSTMLNGLVHTLYGLEKAGKDRFRSWSGAAAFKGELTLTSKGVTYQISMDFDRDRVAVARLDEDTRKFVSLIREQSHVPAGKMSKPYLDFLQDTVGTVDVDVFRSAFVVDQPMDNEPELGDGWELVAGEAGGAFEGAIGRLLDRLGKDEANGITRYTGDYGEPRDMNKDRMLEKKREELSSLRSSLARAVSSLDSIAPLIEEQKKVEGRIDAIRKDMSAAKAQSERAGSWRRLRDRWDSKNRELKVLKAEIERIKEVQRDKKRHSDDLAELESSVKGQSMDKTRLDDLRRSSYEVRRAASEAEGIKANYASDDGLGRELRNVAVVRQGAEVAAAGISARAAEESEQLREAVRKNGQWHEKYGEVAGISPEERGKMENTIAAFEAGKLKLEHNAVLIKYSPLLFISAGLAAAYFIWVRFANGGYALAVVAGFTALGFLVKSLIIKKGRGAVVLSPEEEVRIRGRLNLLSESERDAKPSLPDGSDDLLMRLESLIEDARRLEKLAYGISTVIGRLSVKEVTHAAELAGLKLGQDIAGILGMDEAFWTAAATENSERARIEKLISDKKVQIDSDDAVISSLMKGKDMSISELEASYDALTQQVQKTMGDWMAEFQDDPILKISPDPNDLATAMEVGKKAQDELERLEGALQEETRELDRVKDILRDAKAGDIGNVPEIEERIAALEEEIGRLEREAAAIQVAVCELRGAGQEFSASSAKTLKGRITGLLEDVTGDAKRSVDVGNDFKLSISTDGRAVAYEQLSQGTRDQLYICMRVAAAELLGEGRSLPMFFDDSFGTTDSVRLKAMRSLLEEMAGTRQFIILSHSQDIDGWGERIKVSP